MDLLTLDPRAVAATLGVTTQDLADFLRKKADDLLTLGARIARNDPWYAPEDRDSRLVELDEVVDAAKRLMVGAFECDRAWQEDNPSDEDD